MESETLRNTLLQRFTEYQKGKQRRIEEIRSKFIMGTCYIPFLHHSDRCTGSRVNLLLLLYTTVPLDLISVKLATADALLKTIPRLRNLGSVRVTIVKQYRCCPSLSVKFAAGLTPRWNKLAGTLRSRQHGYLGSLPGRSLIQPSIFLRSSQSVRPFFHDNGALVISPSESHPVAICVETVSVHDGSFNRRTAVMH